MFICKECNQVFKSFGGLSAHIKFNHNKKDYYDKYMKKEEEGFCKICNKPVKFYSLSVGYVKFCSKKCQSKDMSLNAIKMWKDIGKQITKKKEKTNLKRYGVKHNMQRKEIIDQVKKTNLKRYGVENVINNKKIFKKAKNKREKTCIKEYGVKNYFQVKEVKEKIKNTFLEKYGVESPLQNIEIFTKKEHHSFYSHLHPCGLYYRGSYEKDFLDNYFNKIKIERGLSFKYEENGKIRVYHSDFYIPSQNLIIEIKNSYLAKRFENNIKLKQLAVLKEGYKWIMIIDKNYSNFVF
jgi:endogenous inhibitor of DNA gyrase (YacG/DUF329 family)